MSPSTTHPPADSLVAFALGKLDPADSAPIEDHLAGCEPCQDEVAAVPPDTLVEAVAAAHTLAVARADGATPTFAAAATPSLGAATRGWGDATAGADADVPAALAAHPKYRVLRRLGTGGMGTVWLAQHEVMHREVAVKVIRPDLLARPGAAGRFLREVRAAARLDHPNIVRAHDAEQAGDSCLLAMEYVAGDTLADLVAGGPLPVAEACRAVRDAARGLAHAHAAGLVHRDVKPHNLMWAADGTVKVLDFGLAGVGAGEAVAAGGEGLTGAGMVVGTPDYIAPEQVADPHAADARADVYGLGCTFYHLLAGRPAFPGGSITEKLTAHETRTPDPIPGLAADLAAVLAKMLAKRPADRYQTADEVVAALDAVTDSWRARGGRPRRPWRRALAVAAGLLFAAFATLAAVVYKVQRDNEEVVISTDDPDVEVVMLRKGELVRLRDPKSGQTWELNMLTNQLGLVDRPDGLTVSLPGREPFVLRRNGREVFRVTRLPRVVPTPPTDTGAVVPRLVRTTDTGNPVRSLGYTPDGGTLVVGGNDLRLYDRATGSEAHREPRPGNVTAAVALSADGKTAAAASQGTVLVFDLDRGRRLKEVPIQSKNSFTFSLALSHDGRTLAYSADGAVRLVDLAADKTDSIPAAQKGSPFGVGFSADGRYLVYTADEMVTILDAKTRAVVEKRHIGTVGLSVVSADGQRLVVTSGTGTPGFSAYPLPSGELYREANLPAGVGALAVSADGGRLALGLVNGTAQVWDLRRKKLLASWDVRDPAQRGPFSATAVAITPDGRTLATGAGSTFRVWDLAGGPSADAAVEVRQFEAHAGGVRAVLFTRDGFEALTCGDDGLIRAWDVRTGARVAEFVPLISSRATICAAAHPVKADFLTGGDDGVVRLWDLTTGRAAQPGRAVRALDAHVGPVRVVAFSPDGKRALYAGQDATLGLWNPSTGEKLRSLTLPAPATGVAFTPDGKRAYASANQMIHLLDLDGNGGAVANRHSAQGAILGLASSKDGRRLLFPARDGKLRLLEFPTADATAFLGDLTPRWEAYVGSEPAAVALSPDGRRALTGGADGVLRLWDAGAGKLVLAVPGHAGGVRGVTFSPDGRHALSGAGDGTVRLWRLDDPRP